MNRTLKDYLKHFHIVHIIALECNSIYKNGNIKKGGLRKTENLIEQHIMNHLYSLFL